MSELYTLDLGILDEAQRGITLALRVDVSTGVLAGIRASLLRGSALDIRHTMAFLLAVDDTGEAVDAALAHVLPESQARLFAWIIERGIVRRPFVLDVIDAAAYEALRLSEAVLA